MSGGGSSKGSTEVALRAPARLPYLRGAAPPAQDLPHHVQCVSAFVDPGDVRVVLATLPDEPINANPIVEPPGSKVGL